MPMLCLRLLKCCAALWLTMLALPVSANCSIAHITSSADVYQVLEENGGYTFKNYRAVCDKLSKADARIVISGDYGVLSNRSYGWANIKVADKRLRFLIINANDSSYTYMHDHASDVTARKLLWNAINDALEGWKTLDEALLDLDAARQTLRKHPGDKS